MVRCHYSTCLLLYAVILTPRFALAVHARLPHSAPPHCPSLCTSLCLSPPQTGMLSHSSAMIHVRAAACGRVRGRAGAYLPSSFHCGNAACWLCAPAATPYRAKGGRARLFTHPHPPLPLLCLSTLTSVQGRTAHAHTFPTIFGGMTHEEKLPLAPRLYTHYACCYAPGLRRSPALRDAAYLPAANALRANTKYPATPRRREPPTSAAIRYLTSTSRWRGSCYNAFSLPNLAPVTSYRCRHLSSSSWRGISILTTLANIELWHRATNAAIFAWRDRQAPHLCFFEHGAYAVKRACINALLPSNKLPHKRRKTTRCSHAWAPHGATWPAMGGRR